ncbi:hypothetical protein AVEN_175998-1 [Araneus ventricosus]|uniref:Uncharacterized protein n=1 Tax=Araneus ventricosus TaxID=182803 RepID=A0A4Y2ENG0_ARAVE|nr:hypothetical protein AVEN_175998-1 [Araneus ventricosus]
MISPDRSSWPLGRGGLAARSRARDRWASGSKPDSTADPACTWSSWVHNLIPWKICRVYGTSSMVSIKSVEGHTQSCWSGVEFGEEVPSHHLTMVQNCEVCPKIALA